MANKNRPKMSPQDRAKQFMPFDAVKGLKEALAKKEKEILGREEIEKVEENAEFFGNIHKNN